MRPPKRHQIAAPLALLFVAVACGGSPQAVPGVDVRALQTDIGLGIEKAKEASPVGFLPRQAGLGFDDGLDFEDDFNFEDDFVVPIPPDEPPGVCDPPGPEVNPEGQATVFPNTPKEAEFEGRYPWYTKIDAKVENRSGKLVPYHFEGFTHKTIDGFDDRTLRGGEGPTQEKVFRFNESQSYTVGNTFVTLIQSYAVRTQGVEPPADAPMGLAGDTDPEKGVFLERIIRQETRPSEEPGGTPETTTSEFRPVSSNGSGVQILGFPVAPGQPIASTGFDQANAQPNTASPAPPRQGEASLTYEGEVEGKEQVELCGARVEAWKIVATRTFNITYDHDDDPATPMVRETTREAYDYWIATQHGARIVKEVINFPNEKPVFTQDQFWADTKPPEPLDD